MSPFEALYGRKCNTPVSWDNPTDIYHWDIIIKGNGWEDGEDQEEFKVFP
jgi:hypothetical protein